MRIALVSHVARPSGAEIVLARLAVELARDHEVHVVFFEDGPLRERLEADGIPVHLAGVSGSLVDARRERPGLPGRALVRGVAEVRRLLATLRPDVVHTHSLKSALVAGTAARSLRIPFIWHLHDRISTDYLPRANVLIVRAAMRVLPDAVAGNSEATLATVRSRGVRALVPNPVPRPPDGYVPRDGRQGSAEVFGLVGRITAWKGQDVFLRAFAQAFPDGPQRAVLVGDAMFGETAFADSLVELVDELGLGDRVERRGFRDDVWAEYARLDVLVHASRIPEPFGLVLVEGLLAGLPVIASDAGGPAEFLAGEARATLVRPDDVDALARALRAASADAGGGAHEVARIAGRFAPANAARITLELYERAADRGGTRRRRLVAVRR